MKNRTTYIDKSLLVSPSQSDERVRVFQRKLYLKAKHSKHFLAYSLYDKLCIDYVLITAYHRVRSNYSKGVGVDGVSFEAIEQEGVLPYLTQLQTELRNKTYRCSAVKRVLIPKEEKGDPRPLGIPTVKDRVVQMALKLLIEPLFEADFIATSYGFRPKKSAQDAIKTVRDNIHQGYQFVYDADLSKYFDTIPHDRLFILLGKRIADTGIMSLIGQWLTAPIQHRNGRLEKATKGSPQGGVISPLLANIYLNVLDQIIASKQGAFSLQDIRIVRYADDFILMSRYYFKSEILNYLQRILDNMGLQINRAKTQLLHTSKSSLYFLGFEFRSIRSKFKWNKGRYTNIRPSIKSRKKLFAVLRETLRKRRHWKLPWICWKLNKLLLGWLNYFSITKTTHIWETVSVIKKHLDYKLFKWLKSKGRKAHRKLRQRPYANLVSHYGLLDIEKYARLKANAKA